jgi:hypothetical protein
MNRRDFMKGVGFSFAAPAFGQEGPPVKERIEELTASRNPAIALNHLGFLPDARKIVLFRHPGPGAPAEFTLEEIGTNAKPPQWTRPLRPVKCDLGPCLAGDFTDVEQPGLYQVTVGMLRSVPFFIRTDLWRRTLPKAFSFYFQERCGVAVPNVHPACHLDDARRRDNGQLIDVTGGWHDAGDLRKWMSTALHSGIAIAQMGRNLGKDWNLDGSGLGPILEELRWGNRYWRKMQDSDGRVWDDAAGGVNGDNSDNHWTDNRVGTADDRYINPSKSGVIQAEFVAVQALIAQLFRETDPGYGQNCLAAGLRCRKANTPGNDTEGLVSWAMAALELYRATGEQAWAQEARHLGNQLRDLQVQEFRGNQRQVRGYFQTSSTDRTPYVNAIGSAVPALVLLDLAATFPSDPDAFAWGKAVRMHLDEYVQPLSERSAFRIIPYGIFEKSPTPEKYRPLAGELTYRYFMPARKQFWWLGMTSHLENYACLLARASAAFKRREYMDLAFRQLEWVMGANPFGACLMTGEGMNNPYPHSRYVGLITGGIMNGIAGNPEDEPILDMEYGFDWRTTEYWTPHNAWYLWAVSEIEKGRS